MNECPLLKNEKCQILNASCNTNQELDTFCITVRCAYQIGVKAGIESCISQVRKMNERFTNAKSVCKDN